MNGFLYIKNEIKSCSFPVYFTLTLIKKKSQINNLKKKTTKNPTLYEHRLKICKKKKSKKKKTGYYASTSESMMMKIKYLTLTICVT